MKNIVTALFIMMSVSCFSQSVTDQNIAWNTTRTFEVATGKMTIEPNRVVVYKKEKLEWQDGRGAIKHSFTVSEVKGTWADRNTTGELTYQITNTQQRGSVTIKKTGKDTSIQIMLEEDKKPVFYELTAGTSQIIP